MNSFLPHTKKKQLLLLFIAWVIVQALLLFQNGIKEDGESLRYIREANLLLQEGHFSSPVYIFYCTQILLIGFSTTFFSSHIPVIIVQLLFNITALFILFNFLYKRCIPYTAVVASTLLLICIPFQLYNSFLYTESIFFSLSMMYTVYLLSAKNLSTGRMLKLFFFLILLCLTRPSGLFFVAATVIYIFQLTAGHWHSGWRWSILLILCMLGILGINGIMQGGGGLNIMKPFMEEHVICDVPTRNIHTKIGDDVEPLTGIFDFIVQHPPTFIHLSFQKTIAFFGLYRTYYSIGHNFILMMYFFPLYILAAMAIMSKRKLAHGSGFFLRAVIFFFWLAVIFSCDEWHNRFFLTLTPILILAAASNFAKPEYTDIFDSDSHR
jgi:hypothetical protein